MIISFINIDIPMPVHYIRFTGIFEAAEKAVIL